MPLGSERAVFADRGNEEGRVPAGPDRLGDRFGVIARLVSLGQLGGRGRPGLHRQGRGGEEQKGAADHRRDRRGSPQCALKGAVKQGVGSLFGPTDPPEVHPLPQQVEQSGGEVVGDQDRDRGDHDRRTCQREQKRSRQDEDRDRHRGKEGCAGEEGCATGAAACGERCRIWVFALTQLLPEARDHQQGVVDAQGKSHHRGHGQ